MIRYTRVLTTLTGILIVLGCAGNRPPAFVVGDAGVRLTKFAEQSQQLVIEANKKGVISDENTARVMVGYRRLGEELQKLSTALRVLATTASETVPGQLSAVDQALRSVRTAMRAISAFVGNSPVVQQVLDSFDQIESIIHDVEMGLAKLRATR